MLIHRNQKIQQKITILEGGTIDTKSSQAQALESIDVQALECSEVQALEGYKVWALEGCEVRVLEGETHREKALGRASGTAVGTGLLHWVEVHMS